MALKAYDWLAYHTKRLGDKIALIDLHSKREFTYRQFNDRCERLAAYLTSNLGLVKGDRVGVLAQNSSDILEIQFACAKAGLVFLPLNWRLTVTELEFIVGDAAPKVLIPGPEFSDTGAALQKLCKIPHLLQNNYNGSPSEYENAIAKAGTLTARADDLAQDDLSTIMYTSGTTGLPKGAMITHGMTFWNAINLGPPARVGMDSKHLVVMPLFHTGGLNCYTNVVFHAGGTVAVAREFDPGAILRLLSKDSGHGITHFLGVPSMYLFMSQHPDFAVSDFSGIITAGIGAAPAAKVLLETWADKGLALAQVYGLTETSPIITVLDSHMTKDKVGSAGLPALHVDVRLVDENDADITEPDVVGEIWCKGPIVTPGYWNRPDATKSTFHDGWFKTGDAARMDSDGYFYIVDRWKDMYISGGENVYPAEVEAVIFQIKGVADVGVIGVAHEKWGETGQACVVRAPGSSITEADILSYCSTRLAKFKQPASVRFIETIPRNASGKTLKRELRREAEEAAQAAGSGKAAE
ncbi:MAG: long-chain fatty acid--CoA ligase [Alphaproteobacteria bacterium]